MSKNNDPLSGPYNFAADLLARNLPDRAGKTAYIDETGAHSFGEVADRADRVAAGFLSLGLAAGDRMVLCMLDSVDFVAAFLGAIKVGLTPIALNTLLSAQDYAYVLTDSEARAYCVSQELAGSFRAASALAGWDGLRIVEAAKDRGREIDLGRLMAPVHGVAEVHPSRGEDVAFWLYSSGSTGRPKGTPHRHSSPALTADYFARQTLGLREDDIVYSAAKLFFAYGLGNALTFPMTVGATTVLYKDRVTPDVVARLLAEHGVTVFYGVPTLYGTMLANPAFADPEKIALRLCVSAGEALPGELGRQWAQRTGVDIVDGIGSTEMLHVYVSNRPGEVRYGCTGRPVPGYEVKLVAESGTEAEAGELGELYVRGPTVTPGYWNQGEKSAATFIDGWMKTGDKFVRDADGYLSHCGRADDMLKVSGLWVSPSEVEGALLAHEAVQEAAVIGVADGAGLIKSKAFIVTRPGVAGTADLAADLKTFTKARLGAFKHPREIEFVDSLPKTATGKIQRHVLREREAGPLQDAR